MRRPAQSSLNHIKREQLKSQLFREVSKGLFVLLEGIDHSLQLTRVDLSSDKSALTIFFYSPEGFDAFVKMAPLLEDIGGPLRSFIAQSLDKRKTPTVVFRYDQAFEKEQRVLQLLDNVENSKKA